MKINYHIFKLKFEIECRNSIFDCLHSIDYIDFYLIIYQQYWLTGNFYMNISISS